MTNLGRAAEHSESNRAAAAIVLAAPERYGGPDSLLCRWAEAVNRAPAPEVSLPTQQPCQLSLELLPETA